MVARLSARGGQRVADRPRRGQILSKNDHPYQFVAIDPELAERLRRSPDAVVVTATERPGFPCRQCLRDADVGDELVLVAHTPFDAASPYTGSSAIYLHRTPCEPYRDEARVPTMLEHRRLSIRGFADDHMLLSAALSEGAALLTTLDEVFAVEGVAFAQVHNAGPGCWNCRVIRRAQRP